jgi:hypothetical protein
MCCQLTSIRPFPLLLSEAADDAASFYSTGPASDEVFHLTHWLVDFVARDRGGIAELTGHAEHLICITTMMKPFLIRVRCADHRKVEPMDCHTLR